MAVTEAKDVAPTAPPFTIAGFTDGEKVITPYATGLAPKGSYFFSRRFNLQGGNYELRYVADDAATLWVGRNFSSLAMIAALSLGDSPNDGSNWHAATRQINLPAGQVRMDFVVEEMPGNTPCGIIFSLWQDGALVYASSAAGWLWDFQFIPDGYESEGDLRRLLPVLTLLPNWKNGVTERLSWLTDVLTSESGAEQRRALRRDPRRTFEVTFLRKGPARAMLDSFFVGMGQDEFLLPLWHEAIKLIDGLDEASPGVDFISGMGSEREWTAGDLVLVNNGDPNHYDILVVGSVNEDGFTWQTPPSRGWPIGTKVYPLREARVDESAPMDNLTSDVGQAQVRFVLSQPMRVAADWSASINGVPLFPFVPNRVQAIKGEYRRDVNVLDNMTGPMRYTDISEHTAVTYNLSLTLYGRANVMRFRHFLAAAYGRARNFLLPTFSNDLVPTEPIIGGSAVLTVRPMGVGLYFRGAQSARRAIVMYFNGQSLPGLYRGIIGIEKQYVDGEGLAVAHETDVWYDRIMLEAALPVLERSAIDRISFIAESRFDMDSFEIHHPTNSSAAVETAVAVRQLRNRRFRDNAYPPSPEFPPPWLQPTSAILAGDMIVTDINPRAGIAEASYGLTGEGLIQIGRLSENRLDFSGIWLTDPNEANLFEVRATLVSGNGPLRLGDLGQWQRLSTTRQWALRSETNWEETELEVVLLLEFRSIADFAPRGACTITLRAGFDK